MTERTAKMQFVLGSDLTLGPRKQDEIDSYLSQNATNLWVEWDVLAWNDERDDNSRKGKHADLHPHHVSLSDI